MINSIRTDLPQETPYGLERDGCAIYLSARKNGISTFGTLKRALDSLVRMGHRTGFVNGEGDGAGVQTDIPRELWAIKLSRAGLSPSLVTSPGFWVGHIFVPHNLDYQNIKDKISSLFSEKGLSLLIESKTEVRSEVLGRSALQDAPTFWQIAGHCEENDIEKRLLDIQEKIESEFNVHFASLSNTTVVYKVRGSVEALGRYYPDLKDRHYNTSIVLCHARYSTNTVSTFERAQPFSILGHNGEINTINRLCQEARQIGVNLPYLGSDSQNIDRTLQSLCIKYGLDMFEALEMLFPSSPYIISKMDSEMRSIFTKIRESFGPYAQGPAGIVARYGDVAMASVDTLGLRPLWYFETEKEHIFSSERGAIFFENMLNDARPLAPGEKMGLRINRGGVIDVFDDRQIKRYIIEEFRKRETSKSIEKFDDHQETYPITSKKKSVLFAKENPINSQMPKDHPWNDPDNTPPIDHRMLSASGWRSDHVVDIKQVVKTGKDLITSLGFDGPLAALDPDRKNIADYFKEKVAVVTNPAIDRGREIEAFSTQTLVGARPSVGSTSDPQDILVTLDTPILTGGHPDLGNRKVNDAIANEFGTMSIEQFIEKFDGRYIYLTLGLLKKENVETAISRLQKEAIQAVESGIQCLVLDDTSVFQQKSRWLDPHLATSAIDEALRNLCNEKNLRRKSGLIIRSASIRNLHDIVLLSSFGADAINPYAMLAMSLNNKKDSSEMNDDDLISFQSRLIDYINIGLQKIISTMGCHELRGYGRVCSSIGLSVDLAKYLNSPNYFGSKNSGLSWKDLDREADLRANELQQNSKSSELPKVKHFYSSYWKKVSDYVNNQINYEDVQQTYQQLTEEQPVSIRHLLDFKNFDNAASPDKVNLKIKDHDMPVVFGAMSFGSQSELAFRTYVHAASILNIICINGEGGELPGILGLYKKNRGQQIASGRFGADAQFINSASVIEIKIGQGAKPGEGGMLPGYKITAQVAEARHTTPFVPLLSPSNNHDLYSIEDLAQLIEELKLVNPEAMISVKCPVVPDIGVIAVGIAKAGADIINLSGYDGGTGAARRHAIEHVGLPVEIGIIQSHRALIDAGIRHKVELWCDGGMKSGEDVIKMILLGANRVGFSTLAMIAIGCRVCRQCNKGFCNQGIATQIRTVEEAQAAGINNFTPLDYLRAVDQLVKLFNAIGNEMRQITERLGFINTQDLVGRADLLVQKSMKEKIDLSSIFESIPVKPHIDQEPGVGRLLVRPRNSLTRLMSELVLNIISENEREITYQDEVMAFDRALGTHLSGELIRNHALEKEIDCLHLRFGPSSIAGNGFGCWISEKIDITIEGGAQDGVGKGANGGRLAVMKGLNKDGQHIDGNVGKSFAYGAIKGILIVQGNADSRACVRLSGASVILGGELVHPVQNSYNNGTFSNLKGYACEYMTAGEVVILGDPGPFAFSGMTGGVVYQKLTPELGFNQDTLSNRIARGACISIDKLDSEDENRIILLLNYYVQALLQTHQHDVADHIKEFCEKDF